MKLIFKEDFLPNRADRIVYRLAPFLAFVPAFLVWSVIPLGGDFSDGNDGIVTWFGHETTVQLADPPIGILLVLALSSIAVYGVMLAGWSSGSKYPLLGSVRASAQMVSYEAALGLQRGRRAARQLARSPQRHRQRPGPLRRLEPRRHRVHAVRDLPHRRHRRAQPPAVRPRRGRAGAGRRVPHRVLGVQLRPVLPGRVHEHDHDERRSSSRCSSAGPQGLFDIPLIPGGLEGTIWFVAKLFIFLYVFVWFRATLPRLRYDQLMDLGWKVLIPLSLGWFLLLAALRVGRDEGWSRARRSSAPWCSSPWSVRRAAGCPRRRRRNREQEAMPADRCDERPIGRTGRQRPDRRRLEAGLMGYLEGFGVTLRQWRRTTKEYSGGRVAASVTTLARPARRREGAQARAPARPPRPQPLRGRDGEVHRVRAVRRRLPGQVHLRPRRRQRSRRPDVAGRALRLRLRDQLSPLHPLRPVRGGLPDRGDHRVEAVRVLLHEPSDAIYTKAELVVDDDGQPQHLPWEDWRDGEDLHTSGWMRATAPSGDADFVGISGWSGSSATVCAPPSRADASAALSPPPDRAKRSHESPWTCIVFVIASLMVFSGASG